MVNSSVFLATRSYSLPVILRTARATGAPCHLRNFRFFTATKKLWVARTSLRLIRLQYFFQAVVCLIAVVHNARHLYIRQFNDVIQMRHPSVYPPQVGSQHATRLYRIN